ncbi:MAG: extracellular solute-binding protein [Anaerostipes hadrus]|nr:extracellular solute-binding protein [Anaerostipes hadrus]
MKQKLEKWWKRLIAVGLIISLLSIGFVIYPKQQKIVLTFGMFAGNQWDVPDDNCYQMIDQVIKEFEKEYPNVTIKYESGVMKDDYSEWLSQKALKGKLPDVFMVLPEDFSTFSSEPIENAILFTKKIERISSFRNLTSDDFDSGNIAFRPMTFSEFRTYKPYPWKINKYFDFEWDCIRLPSGPDGENKTQVDNLLMGMSNRTKHGDMAWQFLKKLCYETKTQQKIFQYRQGISPLKAVTNSKQAQRVLEKSMGENMTDKMKLLDELMDNAMQTPKFRKYNEAYQKIDSEMTRILTDEEEFDTNILKLKQEIDKILNQ